MANADATLARKPVRNSSDQARERRKKSKSREQRRGRVGWAFIAPFAIVFLIFLIAPLAYAFYLSLFTKGLATGSAFSATMSRLKRASSPAARSR